MLSRGHLCEDVPVGVPVLLITGPAGVGKTAVLSEATDLLEAAGIRFAAVDLDGLSWCYPSAPGDDRFRSALTFKNLAAVWRNFRDAGAERLALARVVERRKELERYREAVPGAEITVIRLSASDATLQARTAGREIGLGLEWHSTRARELARIMDRERLEDVLVETDGRTVGEIAREVLDRSGWLPVAR